MRDRRRSLNVYDIGLVEFVRSGSGNGFLMIVFAGRHKVTLHFEGRYWPSTFIRGIWKIVKAWRTDQVETESEVRQEIGT